MIQSRLPHWQIKCNSMFLCSPGVMLSEAPHGNPIIEPLSGLCWFFWGLHCSQTGEKNTAVKENTCHWSLFSLYRLNSYLILLQFKSIIRGSIKEYIIIQQQQSRRWSTDYIGLMTKSNKTKFSECWTPSHVRVNLETLCVEFYVIITLVILFWWHMFLLLILPLGAPKSEMLKYYIQGL